MLHICCLIKTQPVPSGHMAHIFEINRIGQNAYESVGKIAPLLTKTQTMTQTPTCC